MKRPIPWKYILAAAGLVVLVFLVMDLNQRLDSMNHLADKVATVRVEATQVMETQVSLATQLAYAGSDDAVAEWAYDYGLGSDGVTLIQLMPGTDGTPTPAPLASAEDAPQVQNWQVWWELFFGN